MPTHPTPHLVTIGAGNMGLAILRAAIAGERAFLDPALVTVCEPDTSKHAAISALGVRVIAGPEGLGPPSGVRQFLWAIKPQFFSAAAAAWRPLLAAPDTHISIMAGVTIEGVSKAVGSPHVVRVMTNTPAQIGRGTTAVALAPGSAEPCAEFAMQLFASCSTHLQRMEEAKLDAFTALVGSGPAYLYYLAEALAEASPAIGFTREQAEQFIASTFSGAAELWMQSEYAPPQTLRAAVTSKGGTTAAACETLDRLGVKAAVAEALRAGAARAAELANLAQGS